RQIAPLRDGRWGDESDTGSLGERLFAQWRFASEGGWWRGASLTDFYRGVFAIAAIARRRCPTSAPVLERSEKVRFRSILQPFRDLFSMLKIGRGLDRYAAILMESPRRLDEVLTLAVDSLHLIASPTAGDDRRV